MLDGSGRLGKTHMVGVGLLERTAQNRSTIVQGPGGVIYPRHVLATFISRFLAHEYDLISA